MPTVRLDNVSLAFGRRPLLHQVALQIDQGERVCLLGRNGEGKTSLLRLIDQTVAPDSGEVWVRPGVRVASLAQEVSAPREESVLEVIMSGLREAEHEAWQAALQADRVISRLQLDRDAPMSELSGGWRRRVMLGRALVAEPGLLLLDEPTNHLDIDAITWLEDMMMEFRGALLFISHDRAFVRRLATRIVELDRGQLTSWPGDYDAYVSLKAAALAAELKQEALFDKKLAQEEAWIRKGVEARRTRNEGRVRALKQLRLERSQRRERIGQVEIRAQEAAPSGKLLYEAVHVSKAFGADAVIADFSARIMRGDRIGIVGPNGCGKTTLIKLLVGEMEPTAGVIRRGTSLFPAYFDQQREQLDPAKSIMDNLTGGSGETVTIDGRPRHVSGYLRDFLFPPERLHAPVSMLSGGERNRLMLARLFATPSNLLVMDEPTNDLDAETLDLLEELVSEYAGTLLLVSHDRAFLDNVVTSTLVFEGQGRVNEYVGGYSDWLRQSPGGSGAARAWPPARAGAPPDGAGPSPDGAAPSARGTASKVRRLSYKDRRELDALPELIQRLEAEQAELTCALSDPDLYRRGPDGAAAAAGRLKAIERELDAAFARWEALESVGRI